MSENQNQNQNEYSKKYSEKNFFDKVLNCAQKAGISVVYAGLILYYTLQKPITPIWAKTAIIGALGYFISPIDAIVDITPVIGYSDDLGALALAITAVAMFIDEEVKNNAKAKLKDWFGDYDESQLEEIDNKLNSD